MKYIPDLSTAVWYKSSYSDGGANNCVEIARNYPGIVPVRDSKTPDDGQILVFRRTSWTSFLAGVKN